VIPDPAIAVPTLVLVGEHDERFLAPTDYMADRIPGASKVILEGAGHNANVDQPEAFNAALRDFLASFC
jgi:pimeloyl-ACP methyl ester carboxylesterase